MPGVQVERATVRTTWTPGAVSARLCLGRRQTGCELPTPATFGRHSPAAPPPSRSLSAPAGGMSFTAAPVVRYSLLLLVLPLPWARVGVACAERAEGRSAARRGAGSAPGGAERSRA